MSIVCSSTFNDLQAVFLLFKAGNATLNDGMAYYHTYLNNEASITQQLHVHMYVYVYVLFIHVY